MAEAHVVLQGEMPNTEAETLKRARKVKKREAKELLKSWLAANRPSTRVLSALAEICIERQEYVEAFGYARASYLLNRKDPNSLAVFLRILWITDSLLTALAICEELPRKVLNRRPIQIARYLTYFRLGCWIGATRARRSGELKLYGWREKVASIVTTVAHPLLKENEEARIATCLSWSKGLRDINLTVSNWGQWSDSLREVDQYIRRLVELWARNRTRRRVGGLLAPFTGLFFLIPIARSERWRLDSLSGCLWPIFGVAGMLGLYFACDRLWQHNGRLLANLIKIGPLATASLVLTLLLRSWHPSAFTFWLYTGLGAGLLAILMGISLSYVFTAWHASQVYQLRTTLPRAAVLDTFIDLKNEMSDPDNVSSYDQRRLWVDDVERATHLLRTHLRDDLRISSSSRTQDRVDGAIAKLEQMKLMIMSPGKETWRTLDRLLTQFTIAIALGRLGNLPYSKPPPIQAPPTRRQKVASALRGTTIALLPIGALILVDLFIDSSPQILDWFKVLAAIWAVTTILFALDPNYRQKIQAVTELANSARDAGSNPQQKDDRQREDR